MAVALSEHFEQQAQQIIRMGLWRIRGDLQVTYCTVNKLRNMGNLIIRPKVHNYLPATR
jgi:hypothetical protein